MRREQTESGEIHLKGAPVSEGIAIGVPVFLSFADDDIPEFPISTGEVANEIARYRRALSSSRHDLQRLQENLVQEGADEVVSIIDSHIQMLDDPLMTTQIEKKIGEMLKNTEVVFHSVITDYEKQFSKTPDAFFRQRLVDVKDLSKRVLRNLCPVPKNSQHKEIPPNSIIFAKELIPSDAASIQASRVSAFVTQSGGGSTSHAALIARSKGIPYVASIDLSAMQEAEGKCVIVDGLTGDIIVNPTHDTLERYKKLKKRLTTHYMQLENDRHLASETIDGYQIQLFANINSLADVDLVWHHNAAGIGLFRTEYLFMQDKHLFLDEQEQYARYAELLQKTEKMPVVIRLLDIGGDKYPELFDGIPKEPNPVLGCRGIRFLMRRKEYLRVQLRAILRAAIHGNAKILLPMISDIFELREVKSFVLEIEQQLAREGLCFQSGIPIGCMLEVPSAVMICDTLAEECDFLAIGTNDLVQYTLGIDRSNPSMSDFYYPAHPSLIRMIKMVTLEAKRSGIPVTVCGEIASNPLLIPLLLGLGVQNFSCAPRFIPIIKRSVRQYTLIEAYEIAEAVLQMKTSSEITQYLLGLFQDHATEDPLLDE